MKNLKKVILSVTLVTTCLSPSTIFAQEVNTLTQDSTTTETSLSNFTGAMVDDPTLTETEEEKWDLLTKQKEELIVQNNKVENYSTLESGLYTIPVTNYQQEDGAWCGPASVRQSLSFHKSKSGASATLPSQTTLAGLIGTTSNGSTTTRLVQALNNYSGTFGNFVYAASDITDSSDPFNSFKLRVTGDIVNQFYAPILLLETQYLTRYNGKALRHYNTVSGWNQTYGTLRLVDPNWNSTYYGTYWDPFGSSSANGAFRATYNADLNGTNKAMAW